MTATRVDISDPDIITSGMDGIWHNLTEDQAWVTFRKWLQDSPDEMMNRVARHVGQGLYSIVSLSLSKHSVAVVCVSSKPLGEWPEDAWQG